MLTFPNIDPVAVDLGFIQIRWYGISYIAGILGAWALLHHRAKSGSVGWTTEQVADLIFYGILGVILGGRLGSVLFYNLPYYLNNPLDVVKVWQGGMSFHGGLLGVIIAGWLYGRRINKAFFEVTDFLVPVVPVGSIHRPHRQFYQRGTVGQTGRRPLGDGISQCRRATKTSVATV